MFPNLSNSNTMTLAEELPDWERTARVLQPMAATLFFLSSLRLFVAQLSVRVFPNLGLPAAVLIGLLVVSTPLMAIALRRRCSHPWVISALPAAMAAARLAGQVIPHPDVQWVCAALAIALYGVYLPMYAGWLASRERRGIYALTWGMLAAIPLDICLRAILSSADTFFASGALPAVLVILLAGVMFSRTLTWPRRTVREPLTPLPQGGWADGILLAGLGIGMFLGYALFFNASLAGPLANAPYPAAVVTAVATAGLIGSALYYDADSVQLLDQNPLFTALLANLGLIASTALLVLNRPSHWNLPLMAVGLGLLMVDIVLFGRLLVSSSGHPVITAGLGWWLGLLVMLVLLVPLLLYQDERVLIAGAVLAGICGMAAGIRLQSRRCPMRVVRAASWVWVAAVALLVVTAGALFIQPAGAHPDPRQEITLMTYNIRSGFGADDRFDLRRTAHTILAANADIVALQEVNRGSGLNGFTDDLMVLMDILRPAGYRYWEFGPAANLTYGNAVISRYPIVAGENFPYTTVVLERRSCLATRVKIGGRRLAVYSTHLTHVGHSTPERLQQVQELLALVQPEGLPKAVMGDFNAVPDTAEIRAMLEHFADAYAAVGPPPGYTFPALAPSERIDYIFLSPELTPLGARVMDSRASDHRPVVVQVRLAP
jgi:endonuclease/exonuclease/phosphatase family metal-dependent hydrolase